MLWWFAVIFISILWLLLCMAVPVVIYYGFTRRERKDLEERANIEYAELKRHAGYESPARRREESDVDYRKRKLLVTKSGQKLNKLERRERVITWIALFVGIVLLFMPMRNLMFARSTETRYVINEARLYELSYELEDVRSGKTSNFGIVANVEQKQIRRIFGVPLTDEQWHTVETSRTEEYIVLGQEEITR